MGNKLCGCGSNSETPQEETNLKPKAMPTLPGIYSVAPDKDQTSDISNKNKKNKSIYYNGSFSDHTIEDNSQPQNLRAGAAHNIDSSKNVNNSDDYSDNEVVAASVNMNYIQFRLHTLNKDVCSIYTMIQVNKIIQMYRNFITRKYLKKPFQIRMGDNNNSIMGSSLSSNRYNNYNNSSNNISNAFIANDITNIMNNNDETSVSRTNPPLTMVSTSITSKNILSTNSSFGIRYFNNNSIYIGQIRNDKCTGIGKYITSNRDIIMGEYLLNDWDGYCQIFNSNGNQYEGQVKENTFHGIGKETFRDGSHYEGEYLKNTKHGLGVYTWSNGSFYRGEWKHNYMDGYGEFNYWEERNYEGEWKANKMHGIGCFKWKKDGKKYIGMLENDKRSGFGIFVWKIPFRIYIGFWKDGKQNGYGKLLTSWKERLCYWNNAKRIKEFTSKDVFYHEMKKSGKANYGQFEFYFRWSVDEAISLMLDC